MVPIPRWSLREQVTAAAVEGPRNRAPLCPGRHPLPVTGALESLPRGQSRTEAPNPENVALRTRCWGCRCVFDVALEVSGKCSDVDGLKSSDYQEGGMTYSCPTVTSLGRPP